MTEKEVEEIIDTLPMTKYGVPSKMVYEIVRKIEYEPDMDIIKELRKLYYKYEKGFSIEKLN